MHARSGHVIQRCHNSPDGKRGFRVQMTSRTERARRILGILNKVSWVESCLGRRRLTFGLAESRRICALRAPHEMNRKNVYLSPYVKEPLNSKVIKSFVPELRSRYVFFVFRDSYVQCKCIRTLWRFCVPVWICPFHISVSGYGTISRWWQVKTGGPKILYACVEPVEVDVLPADTWRKWEDDSFFFRADFETGWGRDSWPLATKMKGNESLRATFW